MCTVSDKLKLCSCKTENVERLKHYWIEKADRENALGSWTNDFTCRHWERCGQTQSTKHS